MCVLRAFKPSFICRWYKDGKPVKQGEGMRLSANGQRLLVSRAQISDTARFQCVAANEAGDIQRDFTVLVHGKIFKFSVISSFCHRSICHIFCGMSYFDWNVIYAFFILLLQISNLLFLSLPSHLSSTSIHSHHWTC